MEDKEKEKIDINRIITNTISGVLVIILSSIILVSLFTIAKPMLADNGKIANSTEYMDKIEEAMVRIYSTYVDDIDMNVLVEGAISGMAKATEDPYTRFVSQDEYNEMLTSGTEKYGGLGIHITYDEKAQGIVVLSVMPGSPALEEGILTGDIIKKVADVTVNYDNYYESVDAIKGEENTKVNLTILRGEQVIVGDYTRKIVSVNNIETNKLDGNVGYIRILSFENNIAAQFTREYKKLRSENISALVLDLRNNPGGLLNETVNIAKQILPKGEIVRLVYKDRDDRVYNSDGANEIDIPLVVLVNENSASASEILAGAIKDAGVGKLVGVKTYGKGIVQSVESLTFQGALSITTSKYYTSSGLEIHKNGIMPDYEVKLDDEYKGKYYIPYDKDYQLQKAVELIK